VGEPEFSVTELELLAGLADGLTLTEIARKRWVTHSALSRALHGMERRTGLRLVERKGRRLRLTAAGWELARAARRAVDQVSEVGKVAAALRRGETGLLRVLSSATPADYLLPQAIVAFLRKMPTARVSLRVAGLLTLEEELEGGEYDVAIGPSDAAPRGWVGEELYVDELVFFVGGRHPYANQEVPWETLRAEVLVGALSGSGWIRLWARVSRRPFDAEYVVELRNPEAVKQVVVAGCGVGVLPRLAVEKELAAGWLALVRVPEVGTHLPYSFFLPQGLRLGLAERFREAVQACLQRGAAAVRESPARRGRSARGGGRRQLPRR